MVLELPAVHAMGGGRYMCYATIPVDLRHQLPKLSLVSSSGVLSPRLATTAGVGWAMTIQYTYGPLHPGPCWTGPAGPPFCGLGTGIESKLVIQGVLAQALKPN